MAHSKVSATTVRNYSFLAFVLLVVVNFSTLTIGFQLGQDEIDKINNNPHSKWKATRYEKFESREWRNFIQNLPKFDDSHSSSSPSYHYQSKIGRRNVEHLYKNDDIPLTFDVREKWPGCVFPSGNIMSCSAIGTFTISEALSDRFCIASDGKFKKLLSVQYMLECDRDKQTCQGGFIKDIFDDLEVNGTATEECVPFSSGSGEVTSTCSTQCKDGSPLKRYRSKKGTSGSLDIITDMQRDIMKYGTIQAGFKMYFDFYNYKSGVYEHLDGDIGGYFSTRIIGWGVAEDQTPYWICVNDFGTDWGNNGMFWILRGADECGIESDAWSSQADISNI